MSAGCQTPQQVAQPDRGSLDGLHRDHFPRCINLFEVAHLVELHDKGEGFIKKRPDQLLGCLGDRTVVVEVIESGLRPFCPFLSKRFVIVFTYPSYSVLSVQIFRHSDPRDYIIYGPDYIMKKQT
jgi:hypothetical protein